MDRVIATVRIDDRLASYQTFFDHKWAEDMHELASRTKLLPVVDSLTLHWRCVANAHLMPWLVPQILRHWAKGFLGAHPPLTAKVVQGVQRSLQNELGNIFTRRQKKAITAAVDRIASRVLTDHARDANALVSSIRAVDIWSQLIEHSEFQLSLLGSQRLCYAGVYFAYENFVRQCTSLATGTPGAKYQKEGFRSLEPDMRSAFGEEVTSDVADEVVNVARLVRNALVHAGGRVSEELRRIHHGLAVEEGVLQIMAPDTAKLFRELKTRASTLAERAVTLPPISGNPNSS